MGGRPEVVRPRAVGDDDPVASGKRRGTESAGDMVRSMGVVLAVVAVVVILVVRPRGQSVRTVDFAGPARQTRSQASYAVLAPVGLPARWRATSVRTSVVGRSLEWHIGFVTPRDAYAAVEQSDVAGEAAVRRYVQRFIAGATGAGRVAIAGRVWQRRAGGDPEPRGLVLDSGGVTTLVVGSASWAELRDLAAALRSG